MCAVPLCRRLLLLVLLLTLQGCSSLKESHFVPQSPEGLSEWRVEGKFALFADQGKSKSYFTYQQVGENYELAVLMDDPIGAPRAVIRGNVFESGRSTVDASGGAEALSIARHLHDAIDTSKLSYWLRGLPATEDATPYQEDMYLAGALKKRAGRSNTAITCPCRVAIACLQRSSSRLMAKAWYGRWYVATPVLFHPCEQGVSDTTVAASVDPVRAQDVVGQLVPRDGRAPLPRWINEVDFCRQLAKIHDNKLPSSREGLFGPDSMMWKLDGLGAPPAFGAGRALLLQVAHPWVTAGIDQHSEVRNDPLGRARRTFYHISSMVFGSMPQVMASANQVRNIHEEIEGEMTEQAGAFHHGSAYRANEVSAMIWVHATLWETIVHMYEKLEHKLTPKKKTVSTRKPSCSPCCSASRKVPCRRTGTNSWITTAPCGPVRSSQ